MPGISMRKMRRSPMRTVSTSRWVLGSMMRMRGGGAAGADVMLVTKKTIINTRIQTTFRLLPWCIIRTGLISLELIQILKFTCVLFFKIGFNCT